MRRIPGLLLVILLLEPASFSSIQITPTTTLAAQTANNTSAPGSYNLTWTGNARPGNVSKRPIRSLLYSGANTKLYAQLQGWWGSASHMQIGYRSNDPAQVARQVKDAISRGLQGFILDWYGPNGWPTNETAFLLKSEAERHYGFTFAVQEDKGALKNCYYTSGCDPTGLLISHLKYAYYNFELSSAYQRIEGRPVVYFFDVAWSTIDWARVRGSVPGNPIFIEHYQGSNYNPFTFWCHNGAYGWVRINTANPDDWGQSYLQSYYTAAQSSGKHAVGAVYKGFDDRLAAWSGDRVIRQYCGRTWMNTWTQVNAMYNSSRQLEAMQVNTWNDYEEGTEIETGIDPCLAINASLSGSTLYFWPSGAGNESLAVASYSIFVSKDGQNLMKLADVRVGSRSINLASYDFGAGTYYFHVKMQSRAGFQTRMSPAVKYVVGGGALNHIAVVSPMPDGVTVASPIHVVASATAANGPVKVMQIYLDGVKAYEVLNAARIDRYISVTSGRWH